MLPIALTKRHVNAVTAQANGVMRAWSDDFITIADPECDEARERYLAARGR